MCERCDAELAALEADVTSLELDALERDLDIAAGLIPPWATRGMFPHERRARTNFAALASAVDRHAARLVELVTGHRAFIAQAVEDRLHGADTPTQLARVVAGFTDPARNITADVPGYRAATAELQAQAQATLEAAYREARAQVKAEAIAQGVPHEALDPAVIGRDAATAIGTQAQTVANAPGRVVTQAVAGTAIRQSSGLPVDQARTELVAAARTGLDAGLVTDGARVPAQQVSAAGRVDAFGDLPAAASYYASELLDGNTCDPCSLIDGTSYSTLEEADADYGSGTYVDCDGGDRCRGTLVTVWDTETAPTVNDVGGDGEGDGGDPVTPPPAPEPSTPARGDASPGPTADASLRSTVDPAVNNFGTGPQADRARNLIGEVDRYHGVANDGVPAVQWVYGRNDGGGKGGHWTAFGRGPRPRRGRNEPLDAWTARVRAYNATDYFPEIRINDGARVPSDIATLHEFGHRLDSLPYRPGDTENRFWTKATRPTVDRITKARGYTEIAAEQVGGNDALAEALNRFYATYADTEQFRLINTAPRGYLPKDLAYLRSPHEVWARAYSQWAANQIGGTARETLKAWAPTAPMLQWSDNDFAALSPIIEDILTAMGHTPR